MTTQKSSVANSSGPYAHVGTYVHTTHFQWLMSMYLESRHMTLVIRQMAQILSGILRIAVHEFLTTVRELYSAFSDSTARRMGCHRPAIKC